MFSGHGLKKDEEGMESLKNICRRKYAQLIKQSRVEKCTLFHTYKLGDLPVNEHEEALVRSQTLTKLELPNLHDQYQLINRDDVQSEDEEMQEFINVDIIDVLRRLLNEDSQKGLQQLLIRAVEGVTFGGEWIRQVGELLPALEELDINSCDVTEENVSEIYSSFPSLLRLTFLGKEEIKGISGISQLRNLRILNLCCILFESKEDLMELSQLRNLNILNISGQRSDDLEYDDDRDFQLLPTMKYYLDCNIVLPNLTFIDCSFNDITEEHLQKLAVTHPNLMQASVVGTLVEKLSIVVAGRPNLFLKLETLNDCLQCLKFYHLPFARSPMVRTLGAIHEILIENYENQTAVDLRRCLRALDDYFQEIFIDDFLRLPLARCYNELCRAGRFKTFDETERNIMELFLFKSIRECFRSWGNEDVANLGCDETNTMIWTLILEILSVSPTQDFINEVAIGSMLTIQDNTNWRYLPVQKSLTIISMCLEKVSSFALKSIYSGHGLQRYIVQYLIRLNDLPPTVLCIQIMSLLVKLDVNNQLENAVATNEVIGAIMNVMEASRDVANYLLQSQCFVALETLVISCDADVVATTFHSYNESIFLPLMRPQSTRNGLRLQAFSLSIVLFACTDGLAQKQELLDSKIAISNKICNVIETQRGQFVEARDPVAFWTLIRQTMNPEVTTPDVVNWGRWVAKYSDLEPGDIRIPRQIIESNRFSY